MRVRLSRLVSPLALSFGCLLPGAAFAVPASAPILVTQAPETPGEHQKVDLDIQETPLRDAIRGLFEGSDLQFTVDPNVPNVPITLRIENVSVAAALRIIVRQASVTLPGLTLIRDETVYVIRMRPAHPVPPPSVAVLPPAIRDRKITLNLREVPFRAAIDILLRGTDVQYQVQPDVPNVPITLSLREIPLQLGLRLIVRQAAVQAPGLRALRSGDVLLFGIARAVPAVQEEAPPEGPTPEELAWERIPLQNADAAAFAVSVGGTVVAEAARPLRAATKVRTPEVNLELPEGEIRLKPVQPASPGSAVFPPSHGRLDRPGLANAGLREPALPAQAFPGGGRQLPHSGSGSPLLPDGVNEVIGLPTQNALMVRGTPEGIEALRQIIRQVDVPQRQVRLRISTGGVSGEGQVLNNSTLTLTNVAIGERISASATPRINGDGTIEVHVEGVFRLNGAEHPLQSRVRVNPGVAIPFMTLGEGPRMRRIWIRATEIALPSPRVSAPK